MFVRWREKEPTVRKLCMKLGWKATLEPVSTFMFASMWLQQTFTLSRWPYNALICTEIEWKRAKKEKLLVWVDVASADWTVIHMSVHPDFMRVHGRGHFNRKTYWMLHLKTNSKIIYACKALFIAFLLFYSSYQRHAIFFLCTKFIRLAVRKTVHSL